MVAFVTQSAVNIYSGCCFLAQNFIYCQPAYETMLNVFRYRYVASIFSNCNVQDNYGA